MTASKYKAEYCEEIMSLGKKGKHVYQFASAFNVHHDTLYEWAKAHSEFKEAFKKAVTYSHAWWEDQGMENITNPDFQYKILEFNLRAKAGLGDKDRRFKIKSITDAKTFSEKAGEVVNAVCNAEITADEAKKLAEVISIMAKVEEMDILKAKLEELEAKIGEG